MSLPHLGVSAARTALVSDTSYPAVARHLIRGARQRCLSNLFIVDPRPTHDPDLLVYGLLSDLAEASWRGVDARLLVGGSRSNLDIAELSAAARATALELGIPCRWLTSRRTRGSHAKALVCDGTVLLGSHNWSGGAFTAQTQDSVRVVSADLAAALALEFEDQWVRAETTNA